jgi:divalent metal cation (Fe/Co/Zn/Cd) transporter
MNLIPATSGAPDRLALAARVRLLSWVTLVWLAIDGVVGMTAGITANSVALIGWGLDCAIEAAAALVIIWRFGADRIHSVTAERLAQKVVAISFILLVPYILVAAVDHLIAGNASGGSWIGIGLAGIDAALMPALGQAKKRLGRGLGSRARPAEPAPRTSCARTCRSRSWSAWSPTLLWAGGGPTRSSH